jgi:hypothetical protein
MVAQKMEKGYIKKLVVCGYSDPSLRFGISEKVASQSLRLLRRSSTSQRLVHLPD